MKNVMQRVIPVTLITGFLGSGKTTLINHILAERPEMKISVVLNEFGDTKLESQFIKGHKGDIFELSNGCMCCVAQEDFVRVVRWILEEKPETEYVLIEASGASDPLPVISTFRESDIADKIQLSTVACVVDAVNFFSAKEKYRTVLVQLSNSDMALISKGKEAGEDEVKKVEGFVRQFVPRMWVGRIDESLPVDLILDAKTVSTKRRSQNENAKIQTLQDQKDYQDPHGRGPTANLDNQIILNHPPTRTSQSSRTHEHSHVGDEIEDLVWESDKPLDFERVNSFLKGLSANVVRVKGVLNILVDGQPRKFLLQYVGERSEVQESEWGGERPYTAIVCVGQRIDGEALRLQLDGCVL